MYYLHGYEDSLAIKLLVAAIWILDTLHILFMCHALYFYMITNYGVLTSLEYIVWSLPVCIPNLPPDAEDFPALGVGSSEYALNFCSPMLLCAPNLSPLSPSGEVVGDCPNCQCICFLWRTFHAIMGSRQILSVVAGFGFSMETAVLELVNHKISIFTQMTFYGVTPAVAIIALAETLITISLCILLYDRRSGSALSRTKRLLNTLIIYAVNRCLLILLVAITALVMAVEGQVTWFLGLSFVIGRLYANSFLASLNSREHLRSKGSGTLPDPRIGVAHFTNPPKVLGDIENFKDGARQVDVPEEDVIDITVYPASDKTTKLCSEGKV
ncbi:hypothetical protein EV401DRAFT_2214532 [Pisolithus croceorrhizus]|nr:hypothetical protein EV401DRAFT_2214532 [Pisolithus croceorrhizus]